MMKKMIIVWMMFALAATTFGDVREEKKALNKQRATMRMSLAEEVAHVPEVNALNQELYGVMTRMTTLAKELLPEAAAQKNTWSVIWANEDELCANAEFKSLMDRYWVATTKRDQYFCTYDPAFKAVVDALDALEK